MKLLEPFKIGNLELRNRVVMPPMDIYMSTDGYATDYHRVHYGARAIGGVGLIIQEATAIRADGRISPLDLGIWDDSQIEGLKSIVDTVHNLGGKIGIQLCEAGRKGKVKDALVYSSTTVPFSDILSKPKAMSIEEIHMVTKMFVDATKRAVAAGYDLIELHAAHGYLLSQFISPIINKRDDEYGKDRYKFLREVVEAVREIYSGPLAIRVSADEWVEGGITPEDIYEGIKDFKDKFDVLDVSTGATINDGILPFHPGYQIPHAVKLKKLLNMPVIAVGLIDNFDIAEYALDQGVDLVAIGRALLRNPNFIKEQAFNNKVEFEVGKALDSAYFNERFVLKNLKK